MVILNGMLSLRENFKPKGSKYNRSEINYFIKKSAWQQIELFDKNFMTSSQVDFENFQVHQLPSFELMSHMVFHKFYADLRKPQVSDVYDLLIAATFPYVDAIITEGNMYDILRKIKTTNNRFQTDCKKVSSI